MLNLRRREFITLLGGAAAVAWPLAAWAQQPTRPVIGFLHVASPGAFEHLLRGFRQGLNEVGVIDGQNAAIEYRWAEGHYDHLPALADELIRRRVSVLVAVGGEDSALAAKAATTTIPIVFLVARDPSLTGLVASLSRPGGNATGVNLYGAELGAKRLGLLHDLVPTTSVIGLLLNPAYLTAETEVREVEAAARGLGCQILLFKAGNDDEIDAAFANMRERIKALLVGTDPFFNSRRQRIVALAAREGVPAMFDQREFAYAGGLMSYGTSLVDAYRQVGVYTAKILRGEKTSELPVLQPTKFEFVINLKTAKALGIKISDNLLSLADEVIE
jgi:putative tryptophan/tyrosine transport system substrate-binding protein